MKGICIERCVLNCVSVTGKYCAGRKLRYFVAERLMVWILFSVRGFINNNNHNNNNDNTKQIFQC